MEEWATPLEYKNSGYSLSFFRHLHYRQIHSATEVPIDAYAFNCMRFKMCKPYVNIGKKPVSLAEI